MSNKHTGEHLRAMLFRQLEALTDPKQDVDLKRAEITNHTAQVIINSAKVEVDYVKAIGGAITLPYVEGQDGVEERPYRDGQQGAQPKPAAPEPDADDTPGPMTAAVRADKVLRSGPPPNHPWNGLGNRVHRIGG